MGPVSGDDDTETLLHMRPRIITDRSPLRRLRRLATRPLHFDTNPAPYGRWGLRLLLLGGAAAGGAEAWAQAAALGTASQTAPLDH